MKLVKVNNFSVWLFNKYLTGIPAIKFIRLTNFFTVVKVIDRYIVETWLQ